MDSTEKYVPKEITMSKEQLVLCERIKKREITLKLVFSLSKVFTLCLRLLGNKPDSSRKDCG